ncbi:hypothetical protein [Methylobacterium platani]|uniref:Uncharacterized protein n=2 Tax=Methylobacterium platani TaxID=427683 RepID=A0A179SEN2_9HYPH|nr:hypothetical protein [Methylobacterium platani]KMO21388.1 hypothetical protein SQ03_03275 [Methylobacterium platani JCM 14648]OAS26336.1 hypothetical protein A5481_06370 [Methylobacterium platani]
MSAKEKLFSQDRGKVSEGLQALARMLDNTLNVDTVNPETGFGLFIFEIGKKPTLMRYVGNTPRPDLLAVVGAWVDRERARDTAEDVTPSTPKS